jgi:hypothetical protein
VITEGMIAAAYAHALSVGEAATSVQVAVILEGGEVSIRADERRRIADEMAELARELQAAGRITASGLVKDMWMRVDRRLNK